MQHEQTTQSANHWDAGELGCSRLIVELRRRLESRRPGETLEVTARDPGAPIDLWVWCRMTGHSLVTESHPFYVIQRKGG